MTNSKVTAIGIAVPEKIIPNSYFETFLDTNDEWILSRTGIQTRRHAGPEEYTSSLCVRATKNLSDRYQKSLHDVDMIIVSTVTPDHPMPSMACMVQYRLEMPIAGAVDLYAACGGFTYGIVVAKGLIAAGSHKKVLVIGAETLSKITDFTDRTSCVLFGDGAGAVLVEATDETAGIIEKSITGAYGEGGVDLYISGLSPKIYDHPIVCNGKIIQNGRKVFKWAVNTVTKEVGRLLELNQLSLSDINWLVPHSANIRILEAISKELNFPMDKILHSITEFGNTSSASIPLALHCGIRDGKVKKGDKVMIFGFGGGLTYAATIFEINF